MWKLIAVFLVMMNAIYIISIVDYTTFMTQIYSFSNKYDNTHRADLRFQMAHISQVLYLLDEPYYNESAQDTLENSSLYYTFLPYEVKLSSYYVSQLPD